MIENIAILNRIRWVALVGQSILLLISILLFEIKLPAAIISVIIVFEFIFALAINLRLQKGLVATQNKLLIYLIFDSLSISAIIYFSGGANNPFIYLLLLYVALGSFMLNRKQLFVLVISELALYSLLNIYQHPIELSESSPLSSFHFHLAGMWVNFILTVILLAIFGLITRTTLLVQEKKVQKLREKVLQDEQILGLGIMAANAAHELGTPLSTMAIIVDDIQHSNISNEQRQDMSVLQAQILKCKEIINRLSNKSKNAQQQIAIESQTNQNNNELQAPLKEHLQTIIERWLVYQPNITLEQKWTETTNNLRYSISLSLEQAITNLLDNAADASLENDMNSISLLTKTEGRNLVIDIIDHGKGISFSENPYMGKQIQSSNKQDGLGWGMFLSNVSIERIGGNVQLLENPKNDDDKMGCVTRITLPIGD